MLRPGEVIDHRYVIEKRLARGGMSNVYLAHSLPEHVRWVIKEVPEDHHLFSHASSSLEREIRILKGLDHPGLVRIVDALMYGGSLLMVTEYVEGVTVSALLKREGALDETFVTQCALQICDVIGYLHSRTEALLYCDLKPANLIVRRDGRIVLIDFGTVTPGECAAGARTQRMGTRGFAAPEQYEERMPLSEATDVYALGCTLRAMLSGGNPKARRLKGVSRAMKHILMRCTRARACCRYRRIAEAEYDLRHKESLGVRGRMQDAAALILFLMFALSGGMVALQTITGADARAKTAVVCLALAAAVFIVLRVPDALLRLLGLKALFEVRRVMASARVNGVFHIGKHMPTKQAISWQDVEIPLDEPMTDVRIDCAGGKVNYIVMNGFVLEKDVFVSLRENYTV